MRNFLLRNEERKRFDLVQIMVVRYHIYNIIRGRDILYAARNAAWMNLVGIICNIHL